MYISCNSRVTKIKQNANKLFHTQFSSNLHLNIGLLSKKGLRVQSIIFRDKRSFNKRTFHLSMFAKFSSVKIVVRIWIQSLLAFFWRKDFIWFIIESLPSAGYQLVAIFQDQHNSACSLGVSKLERIGGSNAREEKV